MLYRLAPLGNLSNQPGHKASCPVLTLVAALCCNRHLLGPSAFSTRSRSPKRISSRTGLAKGGQRAYTFPNFLLISFSSFDPFSVASLTHEFQYIHPSPLEVSYLMELAQLAGLWDSLQLSQWPHTSDFPYILSLQFICIIRTFEFCVSSKRSMCKNQICSQLFWLTNLEDLSPLNDNTVASW